MKLSFILLLLLPISLTYNVHAQDTIFFDDFESGNSLNWEHGSEWGIVLDQTNSVFEGNGHVGATPAVKAYSNMVVEANIKIIQDGLHFNIGFKGGRYLVAIHEKDISLHDIPYGEDAVNSIEYDVDLNKWNNYRAILRDSSFSFYVNDSLLFTYQDTIRIGWLAAVNFECLDRIQIDSVLIISQELDSDTLIAGKSWIRTGGPWGGIGYDVRIDPIEPERMYVTDQWAGNHKSLDGGNNWHPNNNGIGSSFGSTGQSIPIFCLTIDPTNRNNIWSGTFNKRGIYKSTDYGENWRLKVNGISEFACGITFRGFAIHPDNSDVVYCAAEITCCPEDLPAGKDGASRGIIYKTVDGGENWNEILSSNALVRHILINPEHPDTIYASTGIFDRDCIEEEGVWKSVDGGESWFHANNGLSDLTVGGLHMDPNNPEILWAATGRESPFGGDMTGEIFVTRNGAESWEQVLPKGNDEICHTVNSITTAVNNSDIVYAVSECGYFISYDSGKSWESRAYDMLGVYSGIPVGIAAHPEEDQTVLINSYSGGVFLTEDYGKTWQPYSKGYTGAEMLDVLIDPEHPHRVIATGRSGVASSKSAGNVWEGAGNGRTETDGIGIGPLAYYSILEINPQNKNSLLIGGECGSDLFKTTDWKNWDLLFRFRELGVEDNHVAGDIAYANSDSTTIYFGLKYKTLPLVIDRPQHYDPDIISYGIAKSEDSGQSWEFINNGLEETTRNIQTIELHPTNGEIAYIGVYGFGIYKTVNGGLTWEHKSNGLTSYLIADIKISQDEPKLMYAGAEDGGIFKTTDGGENWYPVMNGMDPEASVRSIVFHPGSSDTLYCADWHTGTYVTRNGGDFWFPLNEGLSQRSIQKLAMANDASIMYAATQGSGVFRLPLVEFPPMVESMSHDTLNVITIHKGDSIVLFVDAFDINDDSLSYLWSIEGISKHEKTLSYFTFYTDTINPGNYELAVSIFDTSSSVNVGWQIYVIDPTVYLPEDIEQDIHLKIYPNPLEENLLYFKMEKPQIFLNYAVYNINGQLLLWESDIKDNWIDFSKYDKGIYILRFTFENMTETRKIIRL